MKRTTPEYSTNTELTAFAVMRPGTGGLAAPIVYTVSRCRNNEELYGAIHGSSDAIITHCGIELDHNWWVVTNAFDGNVTCKKCKKFE